MEAAAEYDPSGCAPAAASAGGQEYGGLMFERKELVGDSMYESGAAAVGEAAASSLPAFEEETAAAAEAAAAEAAAAAAEARGAAAAAARAAVEASTFEEAGDIPTVVNSPLEEEEGSQIFHETEERPWLGGERETAAAAVVPEEGQPQLFGVETPGEEAAAAAAGAGERDERVFGEEQGEEEAAGKQEAADYNDEVEGTSRITGDGGEADGDQLFEEEGGAEAAAADSDAAARAERRRLKRERREKKREKKRRRKEKKKKKKKFAEEEAEESEGADEAAEATAQAAGDDEVERDLLGAADADEEGVSPRAAADAASRDAAAAGRHHQHREAPAAAGGEGRSKRVQRKVADGTHVSFFDKDEREGGSEREEEARRRTVTAFDRALERIRLRKKRRMPLSNEECSLYCNKLLQQMSDAMQADVKAMEEGRPATAKLQMLDLACAELVKPKWRHWFLAEGCCQCIAAWLAPLKDNSLSNFTLRNKLLNVLAKLPITSQDLQANDLGKVLVLLWDHPEECDTNRLLIRQLIQRWTRPMLGLGSSHREFLQERDRALEANDLELQQKLVAAANASVATSQNEEADETKYRRARVPINAGHNFLIQPKSYITNTEQSSTRNAREGTSYLSSRILGRMGGERTTRRATRASKLFLEGRNM